MTEADHVLFCSIVGYHVPLFVDEEYSKKTRFGGRICPSGVVMSFSTAMTEGLFRSCVVAMLGVDNGRFFKPLRPGDTIHTEIEVVDRKPESNPECGVVIFRDEVWNQRKEKIYQIEKTALMLTRGNGVS